MCRFDSVELYNKDNGKDWLVLAVKHQIQFVDQMLNIAKIIAYDSGRVSLIKKKFAERVYTFFQNIYPWFYRSLNLMNLSLV